MRFVVGLGVSVFGSGILRVWGLIRDVRSSPWLGRSGGNPNPIVKTFWGLILGFCMVSEKRLPVNIGVICMDRIEML